MAPARVLSCVLCVLGVVLSAVCEDSEHPVEAVSNATDAEEVYGTLRSLGWEVSTQENSTVVTARMKMSDMFHPVMLVPQLIMWGFAPIILANLKMFVMQALMMNKMALNAAIFMTLRNIVFGPRPGPLVKYANHGYKQPPGGSSPHYLRRRS